MLFFVFKFVIFFLKVEIQSLLLNFGSLAFSIAGVDRNRSENAGVSNRNWK